MLKKIIIYIISFVMIFDTMAFAVGVSFKHCLAPQRSRLLNTPSAAVSEYFSSLILSPEKRDFLEILIKKSSISKQTIEFKGSGERVIADIIGLLDKTELSLTDSTEADVNILSEALQIENNELTNMSILTLIKKIRNDLKNGNIVLRVIDVSLVNADIMTFPAFYSEKNDVSYINISQDMFLDIIHSGFREKVSRVLSQMIIQNIITRGRKEYVSDAVLAERFFRDQQNDDNVLSDYHLFLLEFYQKKFYEDFKSDYGDILVELGAPQKEDIHLNPDLQKLTEEINNKAQSLLILKPLLLFKVIAKRFKEFFGGVFGMIASVYFSISFLAAIIVNSNYKLGMEQLSELGISEVSWLFNMGAIIAGIFIVPFARLGVPSYLIGKGKKFIGAIMLALSGIGLLLVGLFPKDIQPMHNIAAAIFFLTGAIGIGSSTIFLAKKFKLKLPMIIAAIVFVPTSIIFLLTRNALLETIAAVTFIGWFFLTSYSIIKAKKKDVKKAAKNQRDVRRFFKRPKISRFSFRSEDYFIEAAT